VVAASTQPAAFASLPNAEVFPLAAEMDRLAAMLPDSLHP